MKRPRRVALNEHAEYLVGTGCVRVAGAVIELTVAEEELFELLLRTPKVTAPWAVMEAETARSNQTLRAQVKGLRTKLGTRAIRTHHGKGVSLQPQFVGAARFALVRRKEVA